jgi:SNF2 family DNA or RNA helicase
MDFDTLPWNPTTPDQSVRLIRNPGQRGVTTGEVEVIANRLHVLVSFGSNEEALEPYDRLEPYGTEPESIQDLFAAARFGRPSDLRQILTYEKVKGQLTNVFYSMESSNTDFYAYQFKPVLKFLESPGGRLLIADEVGLGKTIESTFIWKELQARQDARRLLIVCPSMLRDKWANDLKDRFNLEADVLNTKQLLEKLQSVLQRGKPESFVYVVSYEGSRPPRNWRDPEKTTSTQAELARLINDSTFNDQAGNLLDLVIFDEAHKARNPETLTNQLVGLLCDAASHAVLLTATPIQTQTNNLFQLLRLVSPDDFTDAFNFEYMLRANKPIIEAQSLIWKNDVTEDFPNPIAAAQDAIERALKFSYFKHNSRLAARLSGLSHVTDRSYP